MSILDTETTFLFHLVSDFYKKPVIPLPSLQEVNIQRVLKLSIRNKMGFYVSKALLNNYGDKLTENDSAFLKEFVEISEKRLENLNHTTKTLITCLEDYIIHKTYKGYSVIPNDIDVLAPDFEKALEKLQSCGMKTVDFEDNQVMLISKEGIKVHLHEQVSWADSLFLDDSLVYEEHKIVKLWDVDVKTPNLDADFLINVAHINFEPLHFTVSDFLYLCKIAPYIHWNIIQSQAKKYHWMRTLNSTILLFDTIYHALYSDPCPFKGAGLRHRPSREKITFPFSIPRQLIVRSFLEKRCFGYLSKRLSKVIYILLRGDTYRAFYLPPEQELANQLKNSDKN